MYCSAPLLFLTMAIKTIPLQLTLAQAEELQSNLKRLADYIEGNTIKEGRLLTANEDLLISALSWLHIDIEAGLNKHKQSDINKEREDYNLAYYLHLERLSKGN